MSQGQPNWNCRKPALSGKRSSWGRNSNWTKDVAKSQPRLVETGATNGMGETSRGYFAAGEMFPNTGFTSRRLPS